MVTVRYMSDLHLELFPGFRVPVSVDGDSETLVLAGDIGDPETEEYAAFVADCVSKFERVFVVVGNHEGYGKPSWEHAVDAARRAVEAAGATLLHRDRAVLSETEKIRIVGATLWSHIDGPCAYEARCFMADYRRIGGLTGVGESNALHDVDVAWLRAEIASAEADGYRVLVVTHHAPSLVGTSHPKHAGGALNCAFATDLDALVGRDSVAAWIFGHTHFSTTRGKLRSNQRGYADNPEEVRMFDPYRTVVLL
jgi:hypothetical protein